MIKALFDIREDRAAFTIEGHSGFAAEGSDIVCAAVSSAAYMAANTITEILRLQDTSVQRDGYLTFSASGSKAAADIIRGLQLHISELALLYPDYIKIQTEV